MKRFYLASLVCLVSLVGYSNNDDSFILGQVIRSDGSRLSALVKVPLQSDETTILIKDTATGEGQSLQSESIRSITVVQDGKTVQYVYTIFTSTLSTQGKAIWLKTVCWGEIVLYTGQQNTQQIFFMKQKGDDIPVQLSAANYKSKLRSKISDHRYLLNDLEDNKYDYNDLVVLLDEYNAWKSFE